MAYYGFRTSQYSFVSFRYVPLSLSLSLSLSLFLSLCLSLSPYFSLSLSLSHFTLSFYMSYTHHTLSLHSLVLSIYLRICVYLDQKIGCLYYEIYRLLALYCTRPRTHIAHTGNTHTHTRTYAHTHLYEYKSNLKGNH